MPIKAYRELFELPNATRLAIGGIIARLPISMMPLALLLTVKNATNSYTTGGLAVGLHAGAHALAGPIVGRLADRIGSRSILIFNAISYPLTVATLLYLAKLETNPGLIVAAAAFAGATMPMSTPVLRTAWRRLAPTDKLRRRAFALDTVVIDITYIVGPALVGLLLWLASPNQAVMAATLSACAGTILILSTAVVRTNVGSHTAVWVNPLRSGKLMTLLLAVIAVLFALGIFEVAIVGFSATHNNPALAGILLSLWSVGSAIGGLWFGTLDSSMTPLRRYQWGLLALAITHGLLPLVTDVRVMVITLILAGLTLAPTMANQAEIASSIANPDTSTQIYAWISTMGYVGLAFGATIGGALLEKTNGFTWAFSAGTASLFVAFLVAVIGAYNWTVPRPIEISDNSQTATAPQSQSFSKVQ